MENSPYRTQQLRHFQHNHPQQLDKMSMIAMATPTPHAPFRREFWDEARASSDYNQSRPRSDVDRIALPSIRQVILNNKKTSTVLVPISKTGNPELTAMIGYSWVTTTNHFSGSFLKNSCFCHLTSSISTRSTDPRICTLAKLKQAEACINGGW